MIRLLAAGFVMALVVNQAASDDKKPATTTWVREANGIDLKFEFGKDTVTVTAFHGEDGAIMKCKSKKDKNGVITATVTDVTEKGNFPPTPKKGFEFSFKWKQAGDTATLSDFKWEGLDEAKGIVEGEYKKKQ
jgi:hypothetical protein